MSWLQSNVTSETLKTIAELTQAMILFTDPSQAHLSVLRNSARLQLLLLGLWKQLA